MLFNFFEQCTVALWFYFCMFDNFDCSSRYRVQDRGLALARLEDLPKHVEGSATSIASSRTGGPKLRSVPLVFADFRISRRCAGRMIAMDGWSAGVNEGTGDELQKSKITRIPQ